jgi:hypothetical protein
MVHIDGSPERTCSQLSILVPSKRIMASDGGCPSITPVTFEGIGWSGSPRMAFCPIETLVKAAKKIKNPNLPT